MIPKKIWTCWLGDEPNATVKKCIESQKIPGYAHEVITLNNYYKGSRYVNECIAAKRWVKASDWLRMHALYTYGGIYLCADMEVLPGKDFGHLLDCDMFIPREECGHYGNAGCGSIPGTRIVKEYLDKVENNCLGAGDDVYTPGIRYFTDICWLAKKDGWYTNVKELTPDYFFPYNAMERTTKITPNTLVFHHFLNSWVAEEYSHLPVVSFLIPTLGREEGLQKCISSIQKLNYPDHLKEIIVLDGPGTVPVKVAQGFTQAHGSLIVYAANDMKFTPDSLIKAVEASKKHGLVAFNSGPVYPDKGNICEHFLIRRDLVNKLGEIFSLKFHHVGCDNLLWAKASKLDEAIWCEEAIIIHNHFTKGAPMDDIYHRGWSKVEEDRTVLKEELSML